MQDSHLEAQPCSATLLYLSGPLLTFPPTPQVHQGMHWVCAMVDLQNRRLVYYDSLKVLFSEGD